MKTPFFTPSSSGIVSLLPIKNNNDLRSPGISVIFVSYNVKNLLLQSLEIFYEGYRRLAPKERYPLEIIVVDNASEDGSIAAVQQAFPDVLCIAQKSNGGFSQAVNCAVRHSHQEILLILNPDTECPGDLLPAMLNYLHKDVGAVGFRQVNSQKQWQMSHGYGPSFLAELRRFFLQHALDRNLPYASGIAEFFLKKTQEVGWVAASCLLVWRVAFEKVGGFDEKYFLYFEDIDFCLRLKDKVGTVLYCPEITVLHHRGASSQQNKLQARKAYRESQIYHWSTYRGSLWGALIKIYCKLRS